MIIKKYVKPVYSHVPLPNLFNISNVKNPENMLTRHIHANIGHQNISSCFDCIFKQVDEYDGTIFCTENSFRMISDLQGYGNSKTCEKFRRGEK